MLSDTVVSYYWAPWCSSCKTVGPMLEAMCAARGVTLTKVNVDAHAQPLDPRVAHYTALPIVLIVDGKGTHISFAGGSITARTMSDSIR